MAQTRPASEVVRGAGPQRRAFSRRRAALSALAGVVVAAVAYGLLRQPTLAAILGWPVAGLTFLCWTWAVVWPKDPEETAHMAVREDPTRPIADTLVLAAAVVSMLAVAFVIARARQEHGVDQTVHVVLGVLSIVVSWAVVHTVFTLTYARLYYSGPDGGVDFNQAGRPRYSDFAYLAFTVGMTFQVSDTAVNANEIRRACLRHAWISYLFGAVILASTINLVAGLSK